MAKIRITVVKQAGNCAAGHKAGQEFVYEGRLPSGLCPSAWHSLFPYLRVLQFGGNFPWAKEGEAHIACPDPENPVVFKLERLKE